MDDGSDISKKELPVYVDCDGFLMPTEALLDVFREGVRFRPTRNDVVTATFPKCGTTWMMQIVLLIRRNGDPPRDPDDYFGSIAFVELEGVPPEPARSKIKCFKTHLPFDRIAYSPEAKYIYVARKPEDCVVSFYHHTKFFHAYRFSHGTFDDYFELFLRGKTDFGDYFDHLLSWYEQRHNPNIFFTTYERMKADPRGVVLQVAEFLGDEYREKLLANGGELLEKVLRYSSFQYMKETVQQFTEEVYITDMHREITDDMSPALKNLIRCTLEAEREGHFPIGSFVRKGGVGDGKLALNADQRSRLNARMQEKTRDSDVVAFFWGK